MCWDPGVCFTVRNVENEIMGLNQGYSRDEHGKGYKFVF